MNVSRSKALFLAGVMAIAALACAIPVKTAQAATPNYSATAPGIVVIPLHISGQYTATTAAVARFNMPFKCKLVGVGASARASTGTTPTLTVDLKTAGVSALSAPVAVTAGAYAEATIATALVPDESAMTVDLAITGTTPTWNDIVVFITVIRT